MSRAKRLKSKKESKEALTKNKKIKKVTLIILAIIFVVIMIVSLVKIINWNIENENTGRILNEISQHITIDTTKKDDDDIEKYKVNFKELKEKNPDTVAWLKVFGTDIEYTVVKSNDNEFYLTHSYDGSYNTAGWPFADYRNKIDGTDKNIIVYGHNRRDGSMFGTLSDTIEEEWYQNTKNRKIIFATEQGTNLYEIFSIYTVDDESYYITTAFGNNFGKFVNDMKRRSEREFEAQVNENDKILTLSTCGADNTRFVVQAKKIK